MVFHGFSGHVVFSFFNGSVLAEDYLSGKDLTFWNILLTTIRRNHRIGKRDRISA